MINLVKAVEGLDIQPSGIEDVARFHDSKNKITKFWDVVKARNEVPKPMVFSDGNGNSWPPWPEPQPMDSFSANLSNPEPVSPCLATEDALSHLWSCSSIQKARHEIQLSDSAAYFLNQLPRIFRKKYTPTDEDVLRARVGTEGIVKVEFAFQHLTVSRNDAFSNRCPQKILLSDNNKHSSNYYPFLYFQLHIYDVAGQRAAQTKWYHCFDNITAILYVVDMSEYAKDLVEDHQVSRIHGTLKRFKDTVNNASFRMKPTILLLNKMDIFQESVRSKSIRCAFPDYKGDSHSVQESANFIIEKFTALNEYGLGKRPIYCYQMTALNTDEVNVVFNRGVSDIILHSVMTETGLV